MKAINERKLRQAWQNCFTNYNHGRRRRHKYWLGVFEKQLGSNDIKDVITACKWLHETRDA